MEKIVFLVIAAVLLLSGCVEVKDPEAAPAVSEMQVETAGDLIVDEPLYFFKGAFRNQRDLEHLKIENGGAIPTGERETAQLHFKRILFRPGGVLYIFSSQLEVAAERLESDQGLIKTFPEGLQRGAPQTPALDGGTLKLRVQYLTGQLKVILQGQGGGDGIDLGPMGPQPPVKNRGCDYFPGRQGDPGMASGKSGYIYAQIASAELFSVDVVVSPAAPGTGSYGIPRDYRISGVHADCLQETGGYTTLEGKPGSTGAVGEIQRSRICVRESCDAFPQ